VQGEWLKVDGQLFVRLEEEKDIATIIGKAARGDYEKMSVWLLASAN
jgi:hypothetical protein